MVFIRSMARKYMTEGPPTISFMGERILELVHEVGELILVPPLQDIQKIFFDIFSVPKMLRAVKDQPWTVES